MLSRYTRQGASSRMRTYQYVPWLEDAGFVVTEAPLFPDGYVQGLQRGTKRLSEGLRSYARRFRALLASDRFDLLWIEKEVMPWLPAWFELAWLPSGIPYVLDYDDAVFHYYDQHPNPIVRGMLAGKHPALMRGAALVVAGNEYLAAIARRAGARQVALLPTVIDLQRYPAPLPKPYSPNVRPCVGWIGQRTTAKFLLPYASLFAHLSASGVARFAAVGIDAQLLGLPMDSIPWSEATEVESLAGFDIGIMPLDDAPFERGKCGYKLIQYMACGLPVVASPVGVNRHIVEHGVNGLLAETPGEWEQALRTLLGDADLRHRMGHAGRLKVKQRYCLDVTGPRMVSAMQGVLTASRGGQ